MVYAVRKCEDLTSIINFLGEKDAFEREDERDDSSFYEIDRFVHHLDSRARDKVSEIIGKLITDKRPVILDLMAGWESHIPDRVRPAKVVGLGLNRRELEHNPAVTEAVMHDLNVDPKLPFLDNSFDVVLNVVSVDYMTRPFDLFEEVGRVLKPGGLFLVIFSNRWFPKKVVKIWREATEKERVELAREYFTASGAFDEPELYISMGWPRPKDDKYYSLGVPSDPVFALYAQKKGGVTKLPKLESDLPAKVEKKEVVRRKADIKHNLKCPHCGARMKKWKVPEDPFLEWDSEYYYICFNDECPSVVRGWRHMYEQCNFGVTYRVMYNPDRDCIQSVPVHDLNALKEGIVED